MDDAMRKAEILDLESRKKLHMERAREMGQDLCCLFKIALDGQFTNDGKDELTNTFHEKLTEYKNSEQIWADASSKIDRLKKGLDP